MKVLLWTRAAAVLFVSCSSAVAFLLPAVPCRSTSSRSSTKNLSTVQNLAHSTIRNLSIDGEGGGGGKGVRGIIPARILEEIEEGTTRGRYI